MVPILLAFSRPPSDGIAVDDNPVHPIGGQEPVLYSLPEAVGVDGISKVSVSIPVIVPQGRGRHA